MPGFYLFSRSMRNSKVTVVGQGHVVSGHVTYVLDSLI